MGIHGGTVLEIHAPRSGQRGDRACQLVGAGVAMAGVHPQISIVRVGASRVMRMVRKAVVIACRDRWPAADGA